VTQPIQHIRSLADLRPGDLMISGQSTAPTKALVYAGQLILGEQFRIGGFVAGHLGMVVESADPQLPGSSPWLVQAMPSGAEEIELTEAHWTGKHAYVRLPEDYAGQAVDAAAIARLFVTERVPYSFLSYAALAAWRFGLKTPRLEKWINRRRPPIMLDGFGGVALPAEAICSVLVDQAWSLAGKRVMSGVAPQCVTPGALAREILLRHRGAIWGGKDFS
jgi:hypothetical protein